MIGQRIEHDLPVGPVLTAIVECIEQSAAGRRLAEQDRARMLAQRQAGFLRLAFLCLLGVPRRLDQCRCGHHHAVDDQRRVAGYYADHDHRRRSDER
ncbi:hypothetical protein [Flavisphingopyxis soli]|uniref:hypothetical protein n=1 Tax=Flavisphingopyxis soli TaxID=2601267 RepID=UPI001375EFE6|nr:hypothetical protein [Sphingorhabdus soli]